MPGRNPFSRIYSSLHLLLGFQYRAGVRPYTSCYHFAESCVFNKQSPLLILCQHKKLCYPFFQSYGINLPSSLSMVLSKPLVFSTCSPVSVYSTVIFRNKKFQKIFMVLSWIIFFFLLTFRILFFFKKRISKRKKLNHRHHKILPIKDCFHMFFRGRLTLRR